MSGVNPRVAPDGRTIQKQYFGIGGEPVGQRADYAPSGAFLSGANMLELAAGPIAPFSPDLGYMGPTMVPPLDLGYSGQMVAISPYSPDLSNHTLDASYYGDSDVLYGLAESLFDQSNFLALALTAAAGWIGYKYGPDHGINPLVGAVGGVFAASGIRLLSDVVKKNAFSTLAENPFSLVGAAGAGYYVWRESHEPVPAALGALAGLAILGGAVRKAVEG